MKKTHVTYLAILLILLILFALLVRIWASDRAASIVGPTQIRIADNGDVYLMSNHTLYVHNRFGDLRDVIPLQKLGVDLFIGDFWIYKNGDILLRKGVAQKSTFFREIQKFARIGSGEQDKLVAGESILQRCKLNTFECKTFGHGKEIFDKITTFKLYVDEEKGFTYVADTLGHQLLLLDEKGTVIKISSTPFKFPNQILLKPDGLLYVADTNNHRIAAVKIGENDFGSIEKQFKIIHQEYPGKRTWPMALMKVDNRWWVINAGNDMSHGTIMIHDDHWSFLRTVMLPRDADPLCLAHGDDQVLVADPSLMRIYNISSSGELREDFGSELLKLDLKDLAKKKGAYNFLSILALCVLLALLVIAFILARQARIGEMKNAQAQTLKTLEISTGGALLQIKKQYDYHSILGMFRVIFAVTSALLLVLFAFSIAISDEAAGIPIQFIPVFLVACFIVYLILFLHIKYALVEITEQGITYQRWKKKVYSPWHGMRKINKASGTNYKICTDSGNFRIGLIEPADGQQRGWLSLLKPERRKYLDELIEEIKKRAPHVTEKTSIL